MRTMSHGHFSPRSRRPRHDEIPPPALPLLDWHGPTLREFVQQIEHEFGRSLDLSGLRHAGLARDEPLDPSDIRELCDLLGLPAEDFGVS